MDAAFADFEQALREHFDVLRRQDALTDALRTQLAYLERRLHEGGITGGRLLPYTHVSEDLGRCNAPRYAHIARFWRDRQLPREAHGQPALPPARRVLEA